VTSCYVCGADGAHLYPCGLRCDTHAPWALAGLPDPSSRRYCMAVCYCGQGCAPPAPAAPIRDTVVDLDKVRSGKRRASPAAYRAARDTPRRRR
jgi:hypothetical protein